jgi:DNA-binding response OmpR family regulator
MKHSPQKRILIVEDEGHLAEGLKLNLSLQGYDVMITADGVSALEQWKKWRPDLIVLDIMLPGIDGLSVLQSVRLEDERVPILILTAKSNIEDKVASLSYGVDDYITKPFHLEEFLLRVERLLKRMAWAHEQDGFGEAVLSSVPPTYTFGKNRLDFETSTALCGGQKIHLTEQEIRLLKLFVARRGKPLARSKILEIGWGYTGGMTTRTVDNFIVRFRKYFEDDPKQPVYFKSLRSIGYIFDHEEESG